MTIVEPAQQTPEATEGEGLTLNFYASLVVEAETACPDCGETFKKGDLRNLDSMYPESGWPVTDKNKSSQLLSCECVECGKITSLKDLGFPRPCDVNKEERWQPDTI